jgi:hypothetical protein
MNARQFAAVLILGIFTSSAFASGQQHQDRLSVGAPASGQESPALQAIRWRLAESCNMNSECANTYSRAQDQHLLSSRGPLGPFPSTPERRRALGLEQSAANQR